jgi:hypothetical protein
MKILASAVTVFALSVIGSAKAAPAFVDKYRIRVVAGFYTGLYESLALREVSSEAGSFWVAERRKRTTGGITGPTIQIERQWIDGRRCPALANVIASIVAIPARTSTTPAPFHGAQVYLGTARANGDYAVRSDYEGPVTAWWRRAEDELKPCWGTPVLTVDGELLPLTLERDADEEPYKALERSQ